MKNDGATAAARKVNASIQEAIRKLTEDTSTTAGTAEPTPNGRTARDARSAAKKPDAKRSNQ